MKMILIGFTGERNSGKTTASNYLFNKHGFEHGHTFGPGKAMCITYFTYLGIPKATARRMVNGDLKDTPCNKLPNRATPRYFMEHLGHFMGTSPALGPDWTMKGELDHIIDYLEDMEEETPVKIVMESVVYEAYYFKKLGGILIEIKGNHGPDSGFLTSEAVKTITPDYTIVNDGTLEEFYTKIDKVLDQLTTS